MKELDFKYQVATILEVVKENREKHKTTCQTPHS